MHDNKLSRVVYLHHNGEQEPDKQGVRRAEPRRVIKFGRNKPCPCGSGRKYKRCHGVVKYPDHPEKKGLKNE